MKVDEFLYQRGIKVQSGDDTVDIFFEHFGIIGQKWGVRNKEGSKKSTKQDRREQKAQKYVAKAKGYQQQLDTLNKQKIPNTKFGESQRNIDVYNLTEKKKVALADAESKRQGKLSQHQEKVLKGVAIAGAIVATYVTYQSIQSGQAHSLVDRGKSFLSGNGLTTWKKNSSLSNPNLSTDELMSSVVSDINPGFGAYGTKNNCRRATFAYEMRRRGNDVSATKTGSGRGGDASGIFNALNPDIGNDFVGPGKIGMATRVIRETVSKAVGRKTEAPFTESIKKASDGSLLLGEHIVPDIEGDINTSIFKALAKQPNGSRGELGLTWLPGGVHSMAWEVVNNKPVVIDTQRGKLYKTSADLFDDVGHNISTAATTRLDNIPLNEKFLTRWLKDA
jgi:hypothetical protein